MVVGAIERRLPLPELPYSFGLSFLLHGLLVLAVVYAPQWLHGKPFRVPVSYEVTLVSPWGPGSQQKQGPSLPVGQKGATAAAKTTAQPRDLLTLPSRTEEMALPAKRRLSERRPAAPLVAPPAPPKIVAPQVAPPPAISRPAITHSIEAQGRAVATETGVTVGNADPALAYYFVLLQDKITGNWMPPKVSPGTTASISLSLRILRSGQVRDLAVDSPAGDRLLDDSALRAVRLSTPLPPLPPLFKAETLFLELRFTFVGEKS